MKDLGEQARESRAGQSPFHRTPRGSGDNRYHFSALQQNAPAEAVAVHRTKRDETCCWSAQNNSPGRESTLSLACTGGEPLFYHPKLNT